MIKKEADYIFYISALLSFSCIQRLVKSGSGNHVNKTPKIFRTGAFSFDAVIRRTLFMGGVDS